MTRANDTVEYYLEMWRSGDADNAFHGLIEGDCAIVPRLVKLYDNCADSELQIFLIDVISEFRLESSVDFLTAALRSEVSQLWQRALDGLVMMKSRDAAHSMELVLKDESDATKKDWIIEAIGQLQAALR